MASSAGFYGSAMAAVVRTPWTQFIVLWSIRCCVADYLTFRWYGSHERFALTTGWPESATQVCQEFPAVCTTLALNRCVKSPQGMGAPFTMNTSSPETENFVYRPPRENPTAAAGQHTAAEGRGLALVPIQLPSMCGTTSSKSAPWTQGGHAVIDAQVYGILYNPGDGHTNTEFNCVESLEEYWSAASANDLFSTIMRISISGLIATWPSEFMSCDSTTEVATIVAGPDVSRIGVGFLNLPPVPLVVKRVTRGSWADQQGRVLSAGASQLENTYASNKILWSVDHRRSRAFTPAEFTEAMKKRPLVIKRLGTAAAAWDGWGSGSDGPARPAIANAERLDRCDDFSSRGREDGATVEDRKFWEALPKVQLMLAQDLLLSIALRSEELPNLQDEVTVVGYPIGGDNACVTVGVVSRIDMQRYNVVKHFLEDFVNNGRYTGFGSCGFGWQPLENAQSLGVSRRKCPICMLRPSDPKRATDSILICHADMIAIPISVFEPADTTPGAKFTDFMEWTTQIFWTFDVVMPGPQSLRTGYVHKGQTVTWHRRVMGNKLRLDLVVVGPDWVMTFIQLSAPSDEEGQGWGGSDAERVGTQSIEVKLKRVIDMAKDRITSEAQMQRKLLLTLLPLLARGQVYGMQPTQQSIEYRYATALHWSLTQFTPATVDVHPQNLVERTFAILVLIFGLVLFSSFVSSITASMTQLRNMQDSLRTSKTWLSWSCPQLEALEAASTALGTEKALTLLFSRRANYGLKGCFLELPQLKKQPQRTPDDAWIVHDLVTVWMEAAVKPASLGVFKESQFK
eukprot:Skav219970  [mRNA]  locus=scaffold2879:389420:443892:+ [translate_table: standard]